MTTASRGYRTLPPGSAALEAWSITLEGGQTYDNGAPVADFERHHALNVSARVIIEEAAIGRDLGLPSDAELGLILSWRTTGAGVRGRSDVVPIRGAEVSVEALVPAGHAGGVLTMEVSIVLIRHGRDTPTDPLVPVEKGSILWRHSERALLEGIAPRLPMVVIPLGQPPFFDMHDARWFIEVDSDNLEAPADGCIRVYLNGGNESVLRMLADPDSDVALVMDASLRLDVQRELVAVGLLDEVDAFDDGVEYPEGSLGAALSAATRLIPGELAEKRSRAESERARLDVELQGRLRRERS